MVAECGKRLACEPLGIRIPADRNSDPFGEIDVLIFEDERAPIGDVAVDVGDQKHAVSGERGLYTDDDRLVGLRMTAKTLGHVAMHLGEVGGYCFV